MPPQSSDLAVYMDIKAPSRNLLGISQVHCRQPYHILVLPRLWSMLLRHESLSSSGKEITKEENFLPAAVGTSDLSEPSDTNSPMQRKRFKEILILSKTAILKIPRFVGHGLSLPYLASRNNFSQLFLEVYYLFIPCFYAHLVT